MHLLFEATLQAHSSTLLVGKGIRVNRFYAGFITDVFKMYPEIGPC